MKLFLLTWKKAGLTIISFIAAVILHNLVSALLGMEEPVFFILANVIIPLYLLICIIYTIINKIKKK